MVAREARQIESVSIEREMHGIASHDGEAGEEATDGVLFLGSHRTVHASHALLHMPATFSFLQRWCGVLRWTIWTTDIHAKSKSLIIRLLCPTQAHPCRKSEYKKGNQKTPLMKKGSSCTTMLPTRDILVLFPRGLCMARGRKTSLTIRLTLSQRQTLLAWQRATTVPAGLARRARMILLLAHGMTITDIAATVGMSRRHTYKWIRRFVQEGLEGLEDKPRHDRRIEPPPDLPDQNDADRGF